MSLRFLYNYIILRTFSTDIDVEVFRVCDSESLAPIDREMNCGASSLFPRPHPLAQLEGGVWGRDYGACMLVLVLVVYCIHLASASACF